MSHPRYQQPGASAAFWTLFGLFVLGENVMRFRSWQNRSRTRAERWSLLVVVVSVVGAVLAGFGLADHRVETFTAGQWPLFTFGLVLMTSGILIRQWAIAVLGRYFTADVRTHAGQTVVERGPYRWVRHPSYTGLVLFFAGVGFALSSWTALAVLVVAPVAGLVVRIRIEERALQTALGEPYRRFASTRRRLIPGLW